MTEGVGRGNRGINMADEMPCEVPRVNDAAQFRAKLIEIMDRHCKALNAEFLRTRALLDSISQQLNVISLEVQATRLELSLGLRYQVTNRIEPAEEVE